MTAAAAACGSAGDGDTGDDPSDPPAGGEAEREISACFFTDSAVYCAPAPAWPDGDLRVRVDEFYPSACADGDGDGDRIPDFLDMDGHGSDFDDPHRCRQCNRGPGQGGDFRFEVDDGEAKLDRGRVYLRDHEADLLIVPTPGGEPLTILLSADTRIDDGYPAPGADIRAEGYLDDDGVMHAERLKVLCAAPRAMPPEDVPPDCEAVDPRGD